VNTGSAKVRRRENLVVAAAVVAVIMHVDGDLLDHLNGDLLDGGNWHLQFLDDGDVVFDRVLLYDWDVDGLVHGIWGRHGQRDLVHDILARGGAEAARRRALAMTVSMSMSMGVVATVSAMDAVSTMSTMEAGVSLGQGG